MIRHLGAVAALVLAGSLLPAAPAVADPVGDCTSSTGVLVVVDLRPFGGRVTRGCDADPTTGYDALHEADFATTGTQHDGNAFVCRINAQPSGDPCVRTPPTSAYWSYWHANAGQASWSYSQLGATSYKPKNGSIDAWIFGGTDIGGTRGEPCFTPADARAGRATTCPSTPVASKSRPEPRSGSGRTSPGGAAPTTAAPRPPARTGATSTTSGPRPATTSGAAGSSSARPTASGTATGAAAPGTSGTPASAPAIVDASAVASKSTESGGSATPVVLGGLLALVLAAGAGLTVLRRRRTDPDL